MCYLVIYYKNDSYAYKPYETRENAEKDKARVEKRPQVKKVEIAEQMCIFI